MRTGCKLRVLSHVQSRSPNRDAAFGPGVCCNKREGRYEPEVHFLRFILTVLELAWGESVSSGLRFTFANVVAVA